MAFGEKNTFFFYQFRCYFVVIEKTAKPELNGIYLLALFTVRYKNTILKTIFFSL